VDVRAENELLYVVAVVLWLTGVVVVVARKLRA